MIHLAFQFTPADALFQAANTSQPQELCTQRKMAWWLLLGSAIEGAFPPPPTAPTTPTHSQPIAKVEKRLKRQHLIKVFHLTIINTLLRNYLLTDLSLFKSEFFGNKK